MTVKRNPASKRQAAKPAPTVAAPPVSSAVRADRPQSKPKEEGKGSKGIKGIKGIKGERLVNAKKPPKVRPVAVRDGFTMPEADYALIATLKARTLSARRASKKSELLRAGLHALAALDTPALLAALARLEPVKIGRPKKGH